MDTPKDDPQYLKDYIKEHPTNKMAWYLLGRQYTAKGEHGKAKYCFEQAGEVYHAFESGEIFGSAEDEPTEERQPESDAASSRRRGRFWKALVAFVLLLVASSVPLKSDRAASPLAAQTAVDLGGADQEQDGASPSASSVNSAGLLDVVYSKSTPSAANRTGEIAGLLSRFQVQAAGGSPMTLLIDPSWSATAQKWLVWPAPAKPIVSVEHSDSAAGARLTYYDAKTCSCEPANASSVLTAYSGWQNVQLQQLIVRSAVTSYEAVTGAAPQSIEQLVRNYPDNWLSGYTQSMKQYFDVYTAKRRESEASGSNVMPAPTPVPQQQPSGESALLPAADALQQPMRILVDKTTHTLALVSGELLIRSYPVGLGGALTPEGEFTITEKVRNPNGRDNGTFGSRGMTLSDTLYAIHGTNQPSSVGKDKSLGCIRMLTPDIEELFDIVPKGTKVTIGQRLQIPTEPYRAQVPLRFAASTDETNPHKTYKWLD
jgi:lipoprotein-anchoring transpeptidase ErfK/SrfK